MPVEDPNVDRKSVIGRMFVVIDGHHKICLLIITAVFGCSRLFFYQQGIRFDDSTIAYAWQFLDPVLLRKDLLSSVFHLHTQPPLFNLFLGVVIKCCGVHSGYCFAAIYGIMGLIICFSLFSIITNLGTSNALAVAITLLFMLGPPSILYEHWLFYTYPVIMLLCLAVVALQRFLRFRTDASGFVFFALLAALVLLRGGFHLAWLACICIAMMHCLKPYRGKVLVLCILPLCLCGSWYLKNLLLFGSFTSSSLLGMNLSRMTILRVGPPERSSLVEQGVVSPLALVGPFRKVALYKPYLSNVERTYVPVLARELKTTGAENFNHVSYLQISKRLFDDSLTLIMMKPGDYAAAVREALTFFFRPANDYGILDPNRRHIPRFEQFYNRIICCQLGDEGIGLTPLALFLVALVGGGWVVVKAIREESLDSACNLPIVFMWLTVVYVSVVFNCFEIYENQRFRFLIEPYVLSIVGALLGRLQHGRSPVPKL